MEKKKILFFAIGVVAGFLSNLATRKAVEKVKTIEFFPDGWFDEEEMQHW